MPGWNSLSSTGAFSLAVIAIGSILTIVVLPPREDLYLRRYDGDARRHLLVTTPPKLVLRKTA